MKRRGFLTAVGSFVGGLFAAGAASATSASVLNTSSTTCANYLGVDWGGNDSCQTVYSFDGVTWVDNKPADKKKPFWIRVQVNQILEHYIAVRNKEYISRDSRGWYRINRLDEQILAIQSTCESLRSFEELQVDISCVEFCDHSILIETTDETAVDRIRDFVVKHRLYKSQAGFTWNINTFVLRVDRGDSYVCDHLPTYFKNRKIV